MILTVFSLFDQVLDQGFVGHNVSNYLAVDTKLNDVAPSSNFWLAAAVAVAVGVQCLYMIKFRSKTQPWPVVPGALPIVGNPLGGFSNLVYQFREWIVDYGNVPSNSTGLVEVNVFGMTILLVCNNQVATEIIKLRPHKIVRPKAEVEAVNSLGAKGVYSAHGEIWRKDRREMAPLLNHNHLRDYLPTIRLVTDRLMQKWKDLSENVIPINRDFLSYTIDNIGLMAFNQDFDCLRNPTSQVAIDLRRVYQLLTARALSPVWYWRIPFIGHYLDGGGFSTGRMMRNLNFSIESLTNIVNNKNNNTSKDKHTKRNASYLEKLLSQKETMDNDRLLGNLMTMFAAGSETTGNTGMICVWELLRKENTEFVQELVEEVFSMPTKLEEASFDQLLEFLPKLRAFFYEVVRLRGSAPILMFETAEHVKIAGLDIPPGTTFHMDYAYLGTLEGSGVPTGPNGESPADFCAQRWLSRDDADADANGMMGDSDTKIKWRVTKPAPKGGVTMSSGFGNGARICPGQYFAELEIVYCLACILKNFEVSLKPNHPPVKMFTSFTQSPDRDIELVLKPRSTVV